MELISPKPKEEEKKDAKIEKKEVSFHYTVAFSETTCNPRQLTLVKRKKIFVNC